MNKTDQFQKGSQFQVTFLNPGAQWPQKLLAPPDRATHRQALVTVVLDVQEKTWPGVWWCVNPDGTAGPYHETEIQFVRGPEALQTGMMNRIDEVLLAVRRELIKACRKHRGMHSAHEGYAVILEEVDELWCHVKGDTGSTAMAREEALQIAAMGARYALDVAPLHPPCALCDRGDGRLGHSEECDRK